MAIDPTTGKVVGYKPYRPRGLNPHKPKAAPAIPPANIVSSGRRMAGNTKIRYARAVWMIERALRGESVADIAKALNLSEPAVTKEIRRAEQRGVVDKVRDKLLKALEEAPDVYTKILTTDPKELHELSRGYALQLKALDSMNDGLGVFRAESHRTEERKITLDGIQRERAEGAPSDTIDGTIVPEPRIAFTPTSTNGSAKPLELAPPSISLTPANGGGSEGASAPTDLPTKASDSEQDT